MVNLMDKKSFKGKSSQLSSEKKTENSSQVKKNKEEEKAVVKAAQIDKANIRKYKDPEGLTVTKLNLGLWTIKNRKIFLYIFMAALALISAATWPSFIYTYGHYLIFGMKNDRALSNSLANTPTNVHSIVMAQAPKPMVVFDLKNVAANNKSADLYVQIFNPNEKHWGIFTYQFTDGDTVYHEEEGYIYPGEQKYLFYLGLENIGVLSNIKFEMKKLDWHRITAHEFVDWKLFKDERMIISFNEINFTPAVKTILTEKIYLNQLSFDISNNSAYNYHDIDLKIFLYNQSRVVGINSAKAGEIHSSETKTIELVWPGRISRVSRVEIFPEIKITDPSVYIKFDSGSGEPK